MPYYPKSQIKTNLYSQGEYVLQESLTPYIGHFYEISNGNSFTGKYPGDGFNLPLILPLDTTLINNAPVYVDPIGIPLPQKITTQYSTYKESLLLPSPPERDKPLFFYTLPTSQDYTTGIFTRYFAKKNNEPKFIEINLDQYNKFLKKDSTVALDLYSVGKILWKIKGTSNQVYETNKKNTELFENQNKWWGFSQYFKDNFIKYLK